MAGLSRNQKLDYMARAREVTGTYSEYGTYQDELNHVVQTYGFGLGAGITRKAFADFLRSLPLDDADRMLNAFVGKQLLGETEEVLLGRAILYDEVNQSLWDNGFGDERDLDADVAQKAREEDAHYRGMNGRIATQSEIAASAMDGSDLSWLDAKMAKKLTLAKVPPHPMVMLTEGIVHRCREAMLPLTWGVCPNTVRSAMKERIGRLRCLALELSADADDDECLSR